MKRVNHQHIFNYMEQWAPVHLAYDWDSVGLQVGTYTDKTKKVMVTLDVTETVVDEAIANNVNLIIAHHPLLFKSIKAINVQSQKGKVIRKLIKHDITVYAAHTNLDIADGGVNDMLCDVLKVKNTTHLVEVYSEKLYKLTVFVPNEYSDQVRKALGNAGAGFIGEYSHCTFQTSGTGSFKPLEGTKPFIGKKNEITFVKEQKIETIVEEKDLDNTIDKMSLAHPYEEVAYDVYPLQQTGTTFGLGRIGMLDDTLSLQQFCKHVKDVFQIDHLRFIGEPSKEVQKIAVLGGSGEKYMHDAFQAGADVYITGDMTFHTSQDALGMGLSIIDPGHYVEEIMKQATKQYIEKAWPNQEVIISKTNTNPFQFL